MSDIRTAADLTGLRISYNNDFSDYLSSPNPRNSQNTLFFSGFQYYLHFADIQRIISSHKLLDTLPSPNNSSTADYSPESITTPLGHSDSPTYRSESSNGVQRRGFKSFQVSNYSNLPQSNLPSNTQISLDQSPQKTFSFGDKPYALRSSFSRSYASHFTMDESDTDFCQQDQQQPMYQKKYASESSFEQDLYQDYTPIPQEVKEFETSNSEMIIPTIPQDRFSPIEQWQQDRYTQEQEIRQPMEEEVKTDLKQDQPQTTSQPKLKNNPGHLNTIVRKGLRYCFNDKRNGMEIACISKRFDILTEEEKETLKCFVESRGHKKTWKGIKEKIQAEGYEGIIGIIREMIVSLLSDENKKDLEEALLQSRMEEETKEIIRQSKEELRRAAQEYLR